MPAYRLTLLKCSTVIGLMQVRLLLRALDLRREAMYDYIDSGSFPLFHLKGVSYDNC